MVTVAKTKGDFIKTYTIRVVLGCLTLFTAFDITSTASAQTRTIRVVTYNIEDDINGATTPLPGLINPSGGSVTNGGVLEGIGEEMVGSDPAQPLDILALEETTSNPTTIAPIVSGLNSFYNVPGMYAMSTYQATESGGDVADGNGPNAMVYNTTTVQLLASVGVGTPLGSSNGEYRQVVRYEFAPAGVTPTAANEFYVYVSHYKSSASGVEATNEIYRGKEAVIIRNDEANNLPAAAHVLYVGDYNINGSAEACYQTIVAVNAPNGTPQGQGVDPFNPSGSTSYDWTANSYLNMKTDSSTSLHYRDDLEIMTTNVYYGTPGGLALVPGTYHTFGNNGSTSYKTSANSGSNTSLNNHLATNAPVFISASQLYADLTTASDHLPVVADYTIPVAVPSPVFQTVTTAEGMITFTWSATPTVNYQVQHTTDLTQNNWTDLGSLINATNSVMTTSEVIGPDAQGFYRLVVP